VDILVRADVQQASRALSAIVNWQTLIKWQSASR